MGKKVSVGRRVRGIGAQACARHGCFCLGSVVDFELGERQMCMDYSLSEGIQEQQYGRHSICPLHLRYHVSIPCQLGSALR